MTRILITLLSLLMAATSFAQSQAPLVEDADKYLSELEKVDGPVTVTDKRTAFGQVSFEISFTAIKSDCSNFSKDAKVLTSKSGQEIKVYSLSTHEDINPTCDENEARQVKIVIGGLDYKTVTYTIAKKIKLTVRYKKPGEAPSLVEGYEGYDLDAGE